MIRRLLIYTLLIVCLPILSGQVPTNTQFVEIEYGEGYIYQTYYQLSDDAKTQVRNKTWDIAFSTAAQDAAIFHNEATGLAENRIDLYATGVSEFDIHFNPDAFSDLLFNEEITWTKGAFNSIADPNSPFDFGWGEYNPTTHEVVGNQVFILQLRDGTWRKLKIESLKGNTYEFRFANLEGSNEISQTIDLADSPDGQFVYFSLLNNETVQTIPAEWDLVFTRYITPLDDNEGGLLDYSVSGALSGNGLQVAEARGIDPRTAQHVNYPFESQIDVIGFDWKDIDIDNVVWSIYEDRAYFVLTEQGDLWKIIFIDFEGSSTGVAVFEKEYLGTLTSSTDETSFIEGFEIFPNPVLAEANIAFSVREKSQVNLRLFNALGQVFWQQSMTAQQGLNGLVLPDLYLPKGNYFLSLESAEGKVQAKKLTIQ